MVRRVAIAALLGMICAGPWAQNASGTLVGQVRDEARQPAPDVVVQIRSIDTGKVRTAITDRDGAFRFDAVSPGRWALIARSATGRVSETRAVDLALQQTARVALTLGLGIEERVVVEAEGDLLDRRRTDARLTVTGEQIDSLPTAGRDVTDLAFLDSAVTSAAPGVFVGEREPVFAVNGQSARANTFLVDGLDNNDRLSGTNLNSSFSQLVIDEFVLLKSEYTAEFGRATGGVLNILTRRGTNELSWDAFVQGTDASFNSDGEFIEGLPATDEDDGFNRLQVGFRIGGPIKQDRAFYFVAFEHSEEDRLAPFTGVDRDGTAGGRYTAPSRSDNIFFRTDFNLNDRNDLSLRLSFDERIDRSVGVGGVFTPETGVTFEEEDLQLAGSLKTIAGSKLVNELRWLVADSTIDRVADSSRPGVERPSGVFGGEVINEQLRGAQTYQLVDNVTLNRGRHTLKVGFDVIYSETDLDVAFNPNGSFIYDSDLPFEPGDCFVNPGDPGLVLFDVIDALVANADTDPDNDLPLIVPCPGIPGVDDDGDGEIDEMANLESYPVVYTLLRDQPSALFVDTSFALFAQDSWSPHEGLTLDFGVRWDVSTYELPDSAIVDSVIPNGGASRDEDNVAPRFGFTWTPGGHERWVVRGGAGIFYDKLVLAFPATANVTSGTTISFAFPQGATIEYDENLVESEGIEATINALGLDDDLFAPLRLQFSTGTELKTPNTFQTSLGFERALGTHQVVGARYTRVRGFNQPLMVDLNQVDGFLFPGVPCAEEFLEPLVSGIPCHLTDPNIGSIAAIVTEGRTWYDGVDLSYRLNGPDAWLSAGYTWSRSEDMGPDPLRNRISIPPDSRDLSGERGRSDQDRRHRLVVAGETALPFGLRLSGVLNLASGLPFNVTTGNDDNLDGILTDRPDGVGRNTGEDTSLAAVNALRTANDLPTVGGLDEPSFEQVDVRLFRPFTVSGGEGRGEFYLQVFNVFDRFNPGLIEGRVLARNFGQPITLAGPPRTIELGFRFGY